MATLDLAKAAVDLGGKVCVVVTTEPVAEIIWHGIGYMYHVCRLLFRYLLLCGVVILQVKLNGRKLRVNYAAPKENEVWPPEGHVHKERPPVS
jgi:hypothetical protein